MTEQPQWTGYIRGFGEHLGETIYGTLQAARQESSPGERIYQIIHIETVQRPTHWPTKETA